MWHLKKILIGACFLLVTACESVPKQQSDQKPGGQLLLQETSGEYSAPAFEAIHQVRDSIEAWKIAGSFSYIDPEDSGAGRIQWDFQGRLKDDVVDSENVRLIGPIGTGSVELVSSGASASLIAGRQRYYGADIEALLLKVVGWEMPVEEMRYWLFGMPSPKAPGRFWLNEQGHLQSLQQSDWDIQFDQFQVLLNTKEALPRKITAVHRGNQAKVKLVIKRFEYQ